MNKSFKTSYYIHSKDDNIWEDDLLKRKEYSLIGDFENKDLIDLFSGLSEFFELSLRDMESVF